MVNLFQGSFYVLRNSGNSSLVNINFLPPLRRQPHTILHNQAKSTSLFNLQDATQSTRSLGNSQASLYRRVHPSNCFKSKAFGHTYPDTLTLYCCSSTQLYSTTLHEHLREKHCTQLILFIFSDRCITDISPHIYKKVKL